MHKKKTFWNSCSLYTTDPLKKCSFPAPCQQLHPPKPKETVKVLVEVIEIVVHTIEIEIEIDES